MIKKEQELQEENHALNEAKAQLESISDMIEGLHSKSDKIREEALEAIHEDFLEVKTVLTYEILLCWGGPACRIVGNLDEYKQPETAKLEYQDWGTYWTEYPLKRQERETLLEYAQQFYFGE